MPTETSYLCWQNEAYMRQQNRAAYANNRYTDDKTAA